MASTPAGGREIIGGVDTHQDLHTAAVLTLEGKVLGTESFSTTRAGYRAMLAWFRAHGELLRVGVESTGSYGAGIARLLAVSGVPVLEVTGPDPAARRASGKDDALDAVAAAKAARTGCRVQVAKDRSGAMEALRVLRTTRKTAVKSRRAALLRDDRKLICDSDLCLMVTSHVSLTIRKSEPDSTGSNGIAADEVAGAKGSDAKSQPDDRPPPTSGFCGQRTAADLDGSGD